MPPWARFRSDSAIETHRGETIVQRKMRIGAVVASALVAAALFRPGTANAVQWGADYFPNVALTTQDGKVVRFYDDLIKGKKVAVNLIYTRCTATCPLETAKLSQVKKILGDRV